ncbi:MAG: efflux transporter outer membrane subunit [Alphaproteobacteria bacterium]|nr:efflux transporter outer membrane subunit [Alphaproteobacteria bacterium]
MGWLGDIGVAMKRFLMLALVPALAGCTKMGPDFERPEAWWKPASWMAASPVAPQPARTSVPVADPFDAAWWKILNDPLLNEMQEQLAKANLDLKTSEFRVAQARAQLGITESADGPRVNANAGYARARSSQRGTTARVARSYEPYDLFQYGLDLSWEIDLWGRVARLVEAGEAQLTAVEEARRDLQVSTSAELARAYIALRGVQRKVVIVRQNLDIAQQNQRLTRDRAAGGLTTDLDVANASAQVASVEAQLPVLEEQQARLSNAIALLLGEQPGARLAALAVPRAAPVLPPRVPVGVPGDLTRRRPDIRMAEANLHAATAGIGVATADFYPRVTLSGFGAIQGLNVSNLREGAALAYSIGPSIQLPIFEGGRLRRTLELREAQQQEAAMQWQRVVLGALHEVDNALTAYGTEQRRRDRSEQAVAAGRQALGIARLRYEQGVADFLQVLTAQRALLVAEQEMADATTNVSLNLVLLYRALGGGWDPATAAPAPAPARAPART